VKNIQLVIPAAGLGSRFANHGYLKPKPLIDVAGLPMILWVLGNFELQKGDSVIIVSRVGLEIEMEIQDLTRHLGLNVKYIQVPALTDGPAITVQHAKHLLDLDLPLIVANSDQFVSGSLLNFTQQLRESQKDLGLILTMTASSAKWSYVGRGQDGFVNRVIEKVEISNEATVGVYAFSRASDLIWALDQMKKSEDLVNGEYYIAPSYNYLIKSGYKFTTNFIGDNGIAIRCTGTPQDLSYFLEDNRINNYADDILSKKKF
jgi:NDP-sugar pyrophosphorylase family protein